MKKPGKRKMGGVEYHRTREQLTDYMKVPAAKKLKWLEEMRQLNNLVAKHNPLVAFIQEKFRRGEI